MAGPRCSRQVAQTLISMDVVVVEAVGLAHQFDIRCCYYDRSIVVRKSSLSIDDIERMIAAMRVMMVHNRYRSVGGEEQHIATIEAGLESQGVQVSRVEVETSRDLSRLARLRLGITLSYRPAGRRINPSGRAGRCPGHHPLPQYFSSTYSCCICGGAYLCADRYHGA